jgi:hypothetical protein
MNKHFGLPEEWIREKQDECRANAVDLKIHGISYGDFMGMGMTGKLATLPGLLIFREIELSGLQGSDDYITIQRYGSEHEFIKDMEVHRSLGKLVGYNVSIAKTIYLCASNTQRTMLDYNGIYYENGSRVTHVNRAARSTNLPSGSLGQAFASAATSISQVTEEVGVLSGMVACEIQTKLLKQFANSNESARRITQGKRGVLEYLDDLSVRELHPLFAKNSKIAIETVKINPFVKGFCQRTTTNRERKFSLKALTPLEECVIEDSSIGVLSESSGTLFSSSRVGTGRFKEGAKDLKGMKEQYLSFEKILRRCSEFNKAEAFEQRYDKSAFQQCKRILQNTIQNEVLDNEDRRVLLAEIEKRKPARSFGSVGVSSSSSKRGLDPIGRRKQEPSKKSKRSRKQRY